MVVLIISLSSVVALADSDSSKDSAGVFPVGLYENKTYDSLASGSTRANVTLDDIYDALFYNNISVGSYQFFISNTLGRHFSGTDGVYVDTLLQTSNTKLDTVNSILGNSYNRLVNIRDNIVTTNSKLEYVFSAVEDTVNLKWYSAPFSYYGTSYNFDTTFLNSTSSSNSFKVAFYSSSSTDTDPCVYRFLIPIKPDLNRSNDFSLSSVKLYQNGSFIDAFYELNYFLEPTDNGTYLYLFDFPHYGDYLYYFELTYPSTLYFLSHLSQFSNCVQIPFDTSDYQLMKTAFFQMKSANLQSKDSDNIQALKDVYASDDLIQAKQAQQAVEDEVIDTFSGNGSERMTVNDVRGVKDVSSNAKQFLGTGSSSSNALGLFNINGQGLWQWFSQTTADNLDTTSNNRKSSDDYYFYDNNMNDYYNRLGGSYAR